MIKHRIVAALLAAGVLSSPAPVFADHGEPMYMIIYFSDSSHSQEVGRDYPFCHYDGRVGYDHYGQTTEFVTQYVISYCIDGYEDPVHG